MIDADSRYSGVGTTTIEAEEGRSVLYLRRRLLPSSASIDSSRSLQALGERNRLDLVAFRALGDAFAFWRICDANDALNPFELVAERAGRLRIPSGVS